MGKHRRCGPRGLQRVVATSIVALAVTALILRYESGTSSIQCGADGDELPLYGLAGQPAANDRQDRQCEPALCEAARTIPSGLIGVNDGPAPYTLFSTEPRMSAEEMGGIYREVLGVTAVRPDEAGRAFDIRCMFPVSDLAAIPDPLNDANWNWDESDAYFAAIVDSGIAPLLKLGVKTWNSTRLSGLSYYDETADEPHYVIPPQPYAGCEPWPATAPVMEAIGTELILKIVERYNDPSRFGVQGRPALDADSWAESGGFAGVELMNEWATLICGPLGAVPEAVCEQAGGVLDAATWAQACAGEPFQWGSRYWDGTPEQAYSFYTRTAIAVRAAHPKVRIGGPATATGPDLWPCGNAAGVPRAWIDGFLNAVRETSAPMDYFSWHFYDVGEGAQPNSGPTFAGARQVLRDALTEAGFVDVPFVLSEYNTLHELGPEVALVESAAGAAQNTAKLTQMIGWGDFVAAFLYSGLDGAFEPENPYSFPLSCTPEFSIAPGSDCECDSDTGCTPSCTPEDLIFDGTWSDCSVDDLSSVADLPACLRRECQFGPARSSGMGTVFADGTTKPTGAAMRLWTPLRGSRLLPLREDGAAALVAAGVHAVAWQAPYDSRFASLLLANPFSEASDELPTVEDLFGGTARVVGASRVVQFPYGGSPNNPVSGVNGVTSEETLVGEVESACSVQDTDPNVIAPLQAYETQLLAIEYDAGCLCPRP